MPLRVLLSLLCLAACSEAPRVHKLRVGMNPWPGYASLAVAARQGLFAAEGLDVQIVEYASLNDLRRGFDLGQIDVMPSTLVEVLSLRARSRRHPEIVWVADASEGGDMVLARGLAALPDLRGRRIAYEPASLGAYLLVRTLELAGLREDEVVAIGMDQPHMVAALRDGEIDAAISYAPYTQEMLRDGANTLLTSSRLPGEVVDTISIDRSLLDADPTLLPRFTKALVASHDYMRRHPDASRPILAEVTGLSGAAWDEAARGVRIYGPHEQRQWIWGSRRLEELAQRLLPIVLPDAASTPPQLTASHRKVPPALQRGSER